MDDKTLLSQIAELLEQQTQEFNHKLEQRTKKIELAIENQVSKRIDALFDGYKLTHEKQWELERKANMLEAQIDDLKTRLSILESKSA